MSTNGTLPRGRKQLSDQLDRFDTILNGLDHAIPGAIADVIREVLPKLVTRAVHEAMNNANPQVQETRAAQERPNVLREWWGEVRSWLARRVANCKKWVGRRTEGGRQWLARFGVAWLLMRLVVAQATTSHRSSTLPVLAGIGTGVGGYFLGPIVESIALGLLVFGLALVVGLVGPWIRLARGQINTK